MNKIISKFLLTRHKFMPEFHFKQQEFTYSAFGSFTKHCQRIQKFRETDNLKHLYRNKLDKACFTHYVGYSDSKYLAKNMSDNMLNNRASEVTINRKYNGYQRALATTVYNFFRKKTGSRAIVTNKSGVSLNEQQAEELHKPIIKKFKRKKVYPRFQENIWAADLTEMESFS